MAWTTPRTWVSGETVTDTLLNAHVRDNLNAIVNPPYVHVRAATNTTTFGTSSVSPIIWDTEVADTDSLYNPAANTKVTINTAGLYLVTGGWTVAGGSINSAYLLQWMVNSTSAGISQAGTTVVIGGGARTASLTSSTFIRLYANDYVSLGASANSGTAALTTSVTANLTSWMQLRWMGP